MKTPIREFNIRLFKINDDPEACVLRAVIETRTTSVRDGAIISTPEHLALESPPFDEKDAQYEHHVQLVFTEHIGRAIKAKTWPETPE